MKKNQFQLNKVSIATLTQNLDELKNTHHVRGGGTDENDEDSGSTIECLTPTATNCGTTACGHCCDHV